MVVFDCGDCDIALEPVTSSLHGSLGGDDLTGAYPAQVLSCPRCGASWAQCTSGVLIKV